MKLILFLSVIGRLSHAQTDPPTGSPVTPSPTLDSHPTELIEKLENFQCFDEPKVNYYKNNASKEIEGLPQVRLMMCGWEDQCAFHFAAALFMKEKLGMNITFWPTLDYANIWDGSYWDSWANNAYPKKYFTWLAEDDMDLVFEFWPSQLVQFNDDMTEVFNHETEFILPGTVDFGGSVGTMAEESVWAPQYLVDEYPDIVIPKNVRDNAQYRELLINASRGIGGTCQNATAVALYGECVDYIAMYANRSLNPFDEPSYTIPTIFGSHDTYMMSKYGNKLTKNWPLGDAEELDLVLPGNITEKRNVTGLKVSYTTTGRSEAPLGALVKQMYVHRLPFLVNIYVPDINFGTIDAVTGELQKFQKLAYPRNPDQNAFHACHQAGQCQYYVAPLMKAANPHLRTRFKEAFEFYSVFGVSTTQINLLMSYFLENQAAWNNASVPVMEQWLNATCQWMKDSSSESTWSKNTWNISIDRWDCPTGCGFPVAEGSDTLYGGVCDEEQEHSSTGNGVCVCDYPELMGPECRDSCPGLVGPTLNETSGEYGFVWCSGHGTCNVDNRQCECEEGYGDAGCGTKYTFYDFLPLTVAVCVLSGFLVMIGIACIVWLRSAAEYKTVKALSVNMTTLMTIGIIFISASNIALAVPVNSVSCIAWQWLFGLGGVLAIMAPLLKAYRVSRVFHGGKMLRAVKITDAMLMSSLIKGAILEFILCTAYSVAHEVFGGTHIYYNHDELRSEIKCNDSTITSYISMGSYAYFFLILCTLTYYSWGTRRALSVFKESTCAYFSSFLSLLCTLITFVFYMATDDPAFRVAVQAFAIIIVICTVLVLFYAQRIYQFYTEPENRNVTDARGASSHVSQGSSSHSSVMKPGPNANA